MAAAKKMKVDAARKAEKPRAYSYVRFSTPEQAKGDSLRRQTELAENYARAHGLQLDQELTLKDLGVSAFRGDNAETGALSLFLDAVRKGLVPIGSSLLLESLDRLSRRVARKAVRYLEEIVEAGVTVVTLNDGKQYTAESLDGFDFLFAILIMIRGNEESQTKSRRLSAAWINKRALAHERTVTARIPAWLALDDQRKPVLVEDRTRVVRRIVKEYLKGSGVEAIARRLNEERVSPFGKADHWWRSSVAKILQSPALMGTAVFSSADPSDPEKPLVVQRVVEDYYPAAISKDDYERIASRIGKAGAGGRQHKGVLLNVLSGLARCPVCEGTMTRINKASKKKSHNPYLVCAAAKVGKCKYVGVLLAPLEKFLLDRHGEIFSAMPAADATVERKLLDKQTALDVLEEQMEALLKLLEKTPSESLGRRVQKLDEHLKTARDELEALQASAANSETRLVKLRVEAAYAAFKARPVDRKRINGCLREVLERVTVDYQSGYLRFHWRHRGETSLLYTWPKGATE